MTEDELAAFERGLHGPAMKCPHCALARQLLAAYREEADGG